MEMYDQIKAMWRYIAALENSQLELKIMLSKYHDDNCKVCDAAYEADSKTDKEKQKFYSEFREKYQSRKWVESD